MQGVDCSYCKLMVESLEEGKCPVEGCGGSLYNRFHHHCRMYHVEVVKLLCCTKSRSSGVLRHWNISGGYHDQYHLPILDAISWRSLSTGIQCKPKLLDTPSYPWTGDCRILPLSHEEVEMYGNCILNFKSLHLVSGTAMSFGGMAQIFKLRIGYDRFFALKKPHSPANNVYDETFCDTGTYSLSSSMAREARMYNRISHPAFPQYYGAIKIEDRSTLSSLLMIIVEWVDGIDLSRACRDSFSTLTTISILTQVASLLLCLEEHYSHMCILGDLSIVLFYYRTNVDIELANVLLTDDGTVIFLDLGSSVLLSRDVEDYPRLLSVLPDAATFKSSPPQIFLKYSDSVTLRDKMFRFDVFSFGVFLVELWSGKVLPDLTLVQAIGLARTSRAANAIDSCEPYLDRVMDWVPDLPRVVLDILSVCFRYAPENRIAPRDLISALSGLARQL